jgi:uncharacterized protein YeaO (DUF488 family)
MLLSPLKRAPTGGFGGFRTGFGRCDVGRGSMQVWLKRVYDPATAQDGTRILVDRLWPRGVRKEDAAIDRWMKEIAPSSALRKWFGHDPERWEAFRERYIEELEEIPEVVEALADEVRKGRVTLVFAAKDRVHVHARVLKEVLGERLGERL